MTDLTATVLATAGPLAALCAALGIPTVRAGLFALFRPAPQPIPVPVRRRR
ncbi:hypothetical protein Q8W71_06115 [Methylobacterium sp. NEAU 140]|uniref:hypothetical protein n=1 Tax=Methylobacterium sp. NEAU 140 TaxID=3064945 RepID=UPI0027374B13|nr:hypothetical protein [Methylobacterium sp. NEAU 140]MDP4022188.1 hypothetical protein [Methylobacterium sp. NEAU 140]